MPNVMLAYVHSMTFQSMFVPAALQQTLLFASSTLLDHLSFVAVMSSDDSSLGHLPVMSGVFLCTPSSLHSFFEEP